MKCICATCGAAVQVPGDDAIESRGYYWHLQCANPNSFPSPGQLIPQTILTQQPEPAKQTTHYAECWRDPAHHACAVAEIERLLSGMVTERMAREDAAINRYEWLVTEINRMQVKLNAIPWADIESVISDWHDGEGMTYDSKRAIEAWEKEQNK